MEEQRLGGNLEKIPHINTVMVIDDDPDWLFVIKKMLQQVGVGKQYIIAHNGLEALQKLQTIAASGDKLPELIFLDIKMPVMNGFEFLEEVTKSTALDFSLMRVFVCSSSLHPRDKEKADLYPIAGFISKPLTPQILKEILV